MTVREKTVSGTEQAPDQSLETLLNSQNWQRLSPLAVIHFIMKFVINFFQGGLQNLAFLGGIAVFTGDNRWLILTTVGILAVAVLLAGGILSYLNFKFRIDGDSFLIRKGVIQKSRLTLSFDRIQNVALSQPLYFMPFGLVTLALESAGSSGEEVKLAGIPEALAQDIRTHVLREKKSIPAPETTEAQSRVLETAPAHQADAEVLVEQPISELVRYGLSNNNIWVVAGVATGAIFQQYDRWEPHAVSFVENNITPVLGNAPAILALAASAGILLFAAFLMTCSIVGAIIVFYRFKLSYSGGRFIRQKGLFERQETSIPDTKIQSLRLSQPWPALLLRRTHLGIRQVGFLGKNAENTSYDPTLIIPSLTEAQAGVLIEKILPGSRPEDVDYQRVDGLYVVKTLTYIFVTPALLAGVPLTFHLGLSGAIPFLLPFLFAPLVILRWRRFGYFSNGTTGFVRSGFFGTKRTIFSFFKAQGVMLTQSPSQRKKRLATLTVRLAGGIVTVPYMPLTHAQAWRDRILFEVETSRKAWI